jgi:hypothetical protein
MGTRISNRGLTSIKIRAHAVTEEERNAAATLLVESDLEGLGDGVLARSVKTGQEQDEALLAARRVALTKGLDDSTEAIISKVREFI